MYRHIRLSTQSRTVITFLRATVYYSTMVFSKLKIKQDIRIKTSCDQISMDFYDEKEQLQMNGCEVKMYSEIIPETVMNCILYIWK